MNRLALNVEWAVKCEDGIPEVEFRISGKGASRHPFTERMLSVFASGSLQSALRDAAYEFRFNDDPQIAALEPWLASLGIYLGVLEGMGYLTPRLILVERGRSMCMFLIKPAPPLAVEAGRAEAWG